MLYEQQFNRFFKKTWMEDLLEEIHKIKNEKVALGIKTLMKRDI
jgi:hypothetical protein